MCFTIQKITPNYFFFDNDLYSEEVLIMHKRIEKLNKKIEKNKKSLK